MLKLLTLRACYMESQIRTRSRVILTVTHKRVLLLMGSIALLLLAFNRIFQAMLVAEQQDGATLWDPVHAVLPPAIDLSVWIFATTYAAIILSIILLFLESMERLAFAFCTGAILIFLRGFSIVLIPLAPPPGMIELIDPAIAYFNPEQFVATRDLFFSGHCATMFFLYLVARPSRFKRFMVLVNIFVICAISIQRVHYTIDIIGGIVIAWIVYQFMDYLFKRLKWLPMR